VTVGFDGPFGTAYRPRDLLAVIAANHMLENFPLAWRRSAKRARTLSSLSLRSRNVRWCVKACPIAQKRSSDVTGLVRKSSAPAFIALTVVGMSGLPAMNMIGSVEPSSFSLFCSPGPSKPGISTSSRMHALALIRHRSLTGTSM
jgi:hypothetical protein